MKFIENIAGSKFVVSIQRYIEKIFEALASAYDKNPGVYMAAVVLLAVFVVAHLSYRAGKRSRADYTEKKKRIRYDEIDWSVSGEDKTEPESNRQAEETVTESANDEVKANDEVNIKKDRELIPNEEKELTVEKKSGREAEKRLDAYEEPIVEKKPKRAKEAEISETAKPVKNEEPHVGEALIAATLSAKTPRAEAQSVSASRTSEQEDRQLNQDRHEAEPGLQGIELIKEQVIEPPVSTPEPDVRRYLREENRLERVNLNPNTSMNIKPDPESVKVEQINLIKAMPYRKFGPDNRDTNRSGRIFTEEELMKQIRD